MRELKEYNFSDLYGLGSGISSTKAQAGHGSPFLSFSTVFNNYFLPDELPDKMDTSEEEQRVYSIKENDIFVTRTSETIDDLAMSCVALKDYPSATFSGFVKRFRPKNTKESYAKYMGFYLRDKYFRKLVTNNAFMTLRASFNEAIFNNLKIYLPCYEEQVVIGNFLYVLNLKIKNNNKIISELEKHTRLIYDYWFLQFDFPNECGMPYKSSGGKMVWCDELMMDIPEGWKISNVTSILKRMPKTEGILTTEYQMSGCIPIIDQSMKFIAGFTNDESYLIPCTEPIIVFGDHTKIIKFINFPFARGADGTKLIQSNDKRMPSLLLYLNLLHANIHHQGYSRHFKYIKDLLLLLPDEKIADEFTNIADVNYQEIRVLIKENIELAALRDYLQPLLMNGQISFKDKQETVV